MAPSGPSKAERSGLLFPLSCLLTQLFQPYGFPPTGAFTPEVSALGALGLSGAPGDASRVILGLGYNPDNTRSMGYGQWPR
ncbi:uncharacterized protein F5147DRAFT_769749 [Suillus discolor]|uniref:Uncharacterized protein n=1 Tax=Suillus discolor TaxID=1912936 RepID=A0A9P7JY06_9AGAM|nr:uncharacterized protein F5147DRAFT_769749 [Suillus discolor]KAG2115293.1 hypothetical protein F5147DRAFT_769749 [Suillus discolor]